MHRFPIENSCRDGVIRNENGFTLIEMLGSLALSAVLFGILSQFVFSCGSLWVRNDRNYQQQHELKLVYQTLYSHLAQLYPGPYLPGKAVTGDTTQISFWQETNEGLLQVKYRYDSETQQVYYTQGFWKNQSQEISLFREIIDWQLEYYQATTQNWINHWESDSQNELPQLIRVRVRTKTSDLGVLTFPVKAWHREVIPE